MRYSKLIDVFSKVRLITNATENDISNSEMLIHYNLAYDTITNMLISNNDPMFRKSLVVESGVTEVPDDYVRIAGREPVYIEGGKFTLRTGEKLVIGYFYKPLMPKVYLATGFATVTAQGLKDVYGTNSIFTSELQAGDIISINGVSRIIDTVVSDGAFTVTEPFPGTILEGTKIYLCNPIHIDKDGLLIQEMYTRIASSREFDTSQDEAKLTSDKQTALLNVQKTNKLKG